MTEKDPTLEANGFIPVLAETLSELDNCSRNKLAVEAKVRPVTINEIASGKAKQINFTTLAKILVGLNLIAQEKGIDKQYNVEDVFKFDYTQSHLSR